MYVALSGGTLLFICDVTTVQLSNGTVHKFLQNFTFHENVSSLFFYTWVCEGWDECACIYVWNWSKGTIDIQEQSKIVKIYVQSQWWVVLLWYHIFWQSAIQRGRHTQLCIITSLKWIIQICSNFYCWVCKIAFYTHPIHIVVWGNFPFNLYR